VDVTVNRPRRLLSGGTVGPADFADIGTCVGMSWDGCSLVLSFDGDLTPSQVAAVADRCHAVNAVEETLRTRARQAYADNQTYLTLSPPTQAQVVSQVQALTRQVNALIRIVLGALDATD